MKFAVFFAVFLAFIHASYGCRCLPMQDPAYCRTPYLMLVKITSSTDEPDNFRRVYTFDLIRDISHPSPYSTTFTAIHTGIDSASCRLQLDVDGYYLLGGHVNLADN